MIKQQLSNGDSPYKMIGELLEKGSLPGAIIVSLNYRYLKDIKAKLLEMCIEQGKLEIMAETPLKEKVPALINDLSLQTIENFLRIYIELYDSKQKLSFVIESKTKKG